MHRTCPVRHWSRCCAATCLSLTCRCIPTRVFSANLCRRVKKKEKKKGSCQWAAPDVEVNEHCQVWHAICHLSSTVNAACPGHLLSPSLASDVNSIMWRRHAAQNTQSHKRWLLHTKSPKQIHDPWETVSQMSVADTYTHGLAYLLFLFYVPSYPYSKTNTN